MKTNRRSDWHVLYVKSRQEKKIHHLLAENNFESFLPLVKSTRRWSDRKKTIYLPLFPSYIFVKVSSKKELEKVLSIDGACCYIRFGNEYAIATEDEIKKIKYLLNIEGIDQVKTSGLKPTLGKKYKITHGILNGLECHVCKLDNKDQIIVRIDSIQQNITATLPQYALSELVPN